MPGTLWSRSLVCVQIWGMGLSVTVHGQLRRRRLLRLDVERVLVAVGVLGVLATVAIALWGPG